MKRFLPEDERENAPPSKRGEGAGRAAGSRTASDPVAALHRSAGNQAVQSTAEERPDAVRRRPASGGSITAAAGEGTVQRQVDEAAVQRQTSAVPATTASSAGEGRSTGFGGALDPRSPEARKYAKRIWSLNQSRQFEKRPRMSSPRNHMIEQYRKLNQRSPGEYSNVNDDLYKQLLPEGATRSNYTAAAGSTGNTRPENRVRWDLQRRALMYKLMYGRDMSDEAKSTEFSYQMHDAAFRFANDQPTIGRLPWAVLSKLNVPKVADKGAETAAAGMKAASPHVAGAMNAVGADPGTAADLAGGAEGMIRSAAPAMSNVGLGEVTRGVADLVGQGEKGLRKGGWRGGMNRPADFLDKHSERLGGEAIELSIDQTNPPSGGFNPLGAAGRETLDAASQAIHWMGGFD